MGDGNYQIMFMPWAGLEEEIKVGPVLLWPFYNKAEEKIQDKTIIDYLHKYFKCYVDHTGKHVDTIVICSHESSDFSELDESQMKDVRNAVNILTFLAICSALGEVRICLGSPSSDRFQLVGQNFQLDSDRLAVQAGSSLIGGLKIGDVKFIRPWHIGSEFLSIDMDLVSAFNSLISSLSINPEDKEKIFRSLEWFYLSHTESESVSQLSKVVMMSTAFEILLEIPDKDKKKNFALEVDNHINDGHFVTETRQDSKGNEYEYSKAAWWAWDFYELRSKIVHGDSISQQDLIYKEGFTHLDVADIVFYECMMEKLCSYNCFPFNGDEIAGIIIANKIIANNLHRKLEWRYDDIRQ